jgi:uncharacterized membrane protein
MTPERNEAEMRRLSGLAFATGVVAALVLFAGYIVRLPVALWIAALVALCLSALGVLITSVIVGRREGKSIGASLLHSIGEGLRWLWHMTP